MRLCHTVDHTVDHTVGAATTNFFDSLSSLAPTGGHFCGVAGNFVRNEFINNISHVWVCRSMRVDGERRLCWDTTLQWRPHDGTARVAMFAKHQQRLVHSQRRNIIQISPFLLLVLFPLLIYQSKTNERSTSRTMPTLCTSSQRVQRNPMTP